MRRSQHTDEEIAFLLREAESGIAIAAICASARISLGTFYRWRRRLGGLTPKAVSRLRRIEEENGRLRAALAERTRDPFVTPRHGTRETLRKDRAAQPCPTIRHRGGEAVIGRFAFVRTAH